MADSQLEALGRRAKDAARHLARASTTQKNDALDYAAAALESGRDEILAANSADVDRRRDRASLRRSSTDCASLPPGSTRWPPGFARWRRSPTLSAKSSKVGSCRTGSPSAEYGSRSASSASSTRTGRTSPRTPPRLCLKSGNAALLRGSAAAIESNRAIAKALRFGVDKAGLPEDAVVARRGHPPRDRRASSSACAV